LSRKSRVSSIEKGKKISRIKAKKDADTDDSDPEGKDELTLAKEAMNKKNKEIDDFNDRGGFEELLR